MEGEEYYEMMGDTLQVECPDWTCDEKRDTEYEMELHVRDSHYERREEDE